MSLDAIVLTEEKLEELERLAALGYGESEMAMYFDVNIERFIEIAADPASKINYHIRRGILINQAREQMGVMSSAEGGNVQAIQALSKIRYRKDFNAARKDILLNDEIDEGLYHRLEAYVEKGSLSNLHPDEALYIELLALMNGMRRKYGRVKTIKFFCKSPFSLNYSQARAMYEHSINLFYVDSKVEKKAMRELKAQQLEDAADMVLRVAKEPSDYEVYAKLIKLSADIRQLHLPDPVEVPKGTYDRPYQVYTLEPEKIGIDRPDRLVLARQIDSIKGVTEAEKEKAKREANIEDIIPFEEMLYGNEEEA
ncbi:hypothetical protein [uncultured Sanguibacteroides sp.]|uniref:hypothetical protein n=1 Tax=uncultured Sanguibacteroides sp. TaxID=1635151 RepID=UPI0025F0A5E8|nr:hypothetical protein [uncultured Sanguibacteroides sp.]